MKTLSIVLISLFVLLIAVVILLSPSFLFDVERVNKARVNYGDGFIIADYVAGNATMQDVLQIRLKNDKIDTVLANYEKYNAVKSIQVLNDSLVEVVLEDSIYSYSRMTDTIVLSQLYR